MTYSVVFSPGAQEDIIESIQWYNNEKENLGFEFYLQTDERLKQIAQNPLHFSIRFKNIRASKINRYPYLIYFTTNEKSLTILILGVLHTSRNPITIKKRRK